MSYFNQKLVAVQTYEPELLNVQLSTMVFGVGDRFEDGTVGI